MDKFTFDKAVESVSESMNRMREHWEKPATNAVWAYDILHPTRRSPLLRDLLVDSKASQLEWDAVSLIAQKHLRERVPIPPELAD